VAKDREEGMSYRSGEDRQSHEREEDRQSHDYRTDPAKCRISTLRPSVHWFPVGAKVGDECLCGKTTRTAEEAELEQEMSLLEDEMDKWSEEMSDWSREMSDWGGDLHRSLSKGP
jgi:hypothetical protein